MIRRIPALDLLRAFAIILVVAFHYQLVAGPEWLHRAGAYGWAGVDLFFVLSGYLITSQLLAPVPLGEKISAPLFYLRRAFRILPAYWVVLAIYFAVPGFSEGETIAPLWKFLTFTQNFGLDFRAARGFSNAWSLCIEEQFYFLLPLAAIFLRPVMNTFRCAALLLLLIAIGILIRSYAWWEYVSPFYAITPIKGIGVVFHREIYYPTYCRLDPLLLGVNLALVQIFRPVWWEGLMRNGTLWVLFGIAILGFAVNFCGDMYLYQAAVFGYPLVALGFGALVLGGLSPNGVLARVNIPGTKNLAELAFTIYLVHKPIFHLMHERVFKIWEIPRDGILAMGLSGLAVLVAASILRVCVEKPFLRWRPQAEVFLSKRFGDELRPRHA